MDMHKTEIENTLQERREELRKLNKQMDSIIVEIQQIEKENWEILRSPRGKHLKYLDLIKYFKKQSNIVLQGFRTESKQVNPYITSIKR